jgi:hypothetical protein
MIEVKDYTFRTQLKSKFLIEISKFEEEDYFVEGRTISNNKLLLDEI